MLYLNWVHPQIENTNTQFKNVIIFSVYVLNLKLHFSFFLKYNDFDNEY